MEQFTVKNLEMHKTPLNGSMLGQRETDYKNRLIFDSLNQLKGTLDVK
jgi:hypothetical protein